MNREPKGNEVAGASLLAQEREVELMLKQVPPETVGARLHRARRRQGWSIRELAEAANINKNSIVRLEKGGMPQALTVLKLCAAMSIHVASIANPEQEEEQTYSIHRHADDRWYDLTDFGGEPLADGPIDEKQRREVAKKGVAVPMLLLKSRLEQGRIMPSILELFGESETRSHLGEELIYVLEGTARMTIGSDTFDLNAGECVAFWSSEQHRYAPAPGSKLPVRVLSVILHQSDR